MPRHTTVWEDTNVAEIKCDGQEAGTLCAGDDPEPCPVCGRKIRLVWDVRVVEVEGN